ncbi:conserved domain protein [Synechococcus sp. PCC 7335]|uniref:DUF1816 domain-containing protein n=1 Tax=Synechococcus sp. (strain ATCC 29403 / PCC 7335) TaxID=91464 RepID=UPI00017EB867|nr:DUF1816 domain-containing protein [Synechococcus sp. PCC 7335]EDX84054.1 conserved domain protein [Synechococcus sp. PCC 7335]
MNIFRPFSSVIRNDKLRRAKQPWWIKVQTQIPECTYYFGPFESRKEAEFSQMGYVDDLTQEGAQNVSVALEKTHPTTLTSCRFY